MNVREEHRFKTGLEKAEVFLEKMLKFGPKKATMGADTEANG